MTPVEFMKASNIVWPWRTVHLISRGGTFHHGWTRMPFIPGVVHDRVSRLYPPLFE